MIAPRRGVDVDALDVTLARMGRSDVTAAARNTRVIGVGNSVAAAELLQDLMVLTHPQLAVHQRR